MELGGATTLAGLPTHQELYLSKKKMLLVSRSTVSSVGWTHDYDARDSEFEPWPDRPTLTQLVRKCYLCWKFHRAMVTIWNLKRSFRLRALWCWSSTTSRSPHSFAIINSNSSFFLLSLHGIIYQMYFEDISPSKDIKLRIKQLKPHFLYMKSMWSKGCYP